MHIEDDKIMREINTRQNRILEYLKQNKDQSAKQITIFLVGVSRATVNRDIRYLLDEKKIYRTGNGRSVRYNISKGYTYTKPYTIEYFYRSPANRSARKTYNMAITSELLELELFSQTEIDKLDSYTKTFRNSYKQLTENQKSREFERLSIELSWMSSKIEGNTYTLIETELLLEKNKSSDERTKAETEMILNHKEALSYIKDHIQEFKELKLATVKKVQKILIRNLAEDGLRNISVGITGTLYRPLSKKRKLEVELLKIIKLLNSKNLVYEKALLANLLIAYLQPFIDANKRTARFVANAILLANGFVPLSLLTLDEIEYKRAVILFYEQNNVSLFKKIFIEQYIFATENYFLV